MTPWQDEDTIRRLLTTPATWAVVGLSANAQRVAYPVAHFVQRDLGMRIVPVNPRGEAAHGELGYRALADIPDGQRVDVVDCFVNSRRVGQVVDAAIAERVRLGVSAVWLQLGVVDQAAAERAAAAGLAVVMDTCPLIQSRRLGVV